MKRYYLGVMMLALGAAGVVWIAVKEQAATAPSVPAAAPALAPAPASALASAPAFAAASASATPDALPSASASASEAAPTDLDAGSARAFPPLATDAAWSVVGWSMSPADVEAALRGGGLAVEDATEAKSAAKRLRAKSGAWDATIDFAASAKSVERIVVTSTSLTKEEALAVVAKMNERAPATKTIERTERQWKKEGGAVASLVTNVEGTTASMREEHVRERAPGGAIGFAGLRWGMSTREVVGQLTAGRYAATVVKVPATGSLACSMPNAPPDCAKKNADTVTFTRDDIEGVVSFNQFGVRHVELSATTIDAGRARAKALESSLGKPSSFETATTTHHIDHGRSTSIEVEVSERQPGGGLTVVETYQPKK